MKRLVVYIAAVCCTFGVMKTVAQVGVSVQIGVAPPALPVYVQPVCPDDGYLWTPGYWAYGSDGYYWVPGVWMAPPEVGFLWTPGYWGFEGGSYLWHGGYWGHDVGFYGGVCYGFGYGGSGYYGGRWDGGHFRYNTAVSRVNTTVIHNTYVDRTVVANSRSRTSFNGPGGISSRPTAAEEAAGRGEHVQATAAQRDHEHTASTDRNQFASVNKGAPPTTAMNKANGQRLASSGYVANRAQPARPAVNAASHAPQVQRSAPAAPRAAVHNTPQARPNPSPVHNAPAHAAPAHSAPARPQGGGGHGNEHHR